MSFSSMVFLLPFLALYFLTIYLCKSVKAQNTAMLIFSLVFYAWAGVAYTGILLADVAICWFFARRIGACGERRRRKTYLILCVTLVLLILGFFKYAGFLLENVQWLTGISLGFPAIALPVGISFYTFQLISYVADVYRGEVEAQPKFHMLLLYASLFHQCVAGPIVRYRDIQRGLVQRRVGDMGIGRGVSRFAVGLAKKAILADSCGVLVTAWFSGTAAEIATRSAAGLWLAGLALAFQIYFDFSGYSDMAIGLGMMCGLRYGENFNYPYLAVSVTDFWRRWHISLSRFFRDYVYIPLGGSREGLPKQLRNLCIVWLLTGLWHGAAWNYVLWGLYFLAFLIIEKLLPQWPERFPGVIKRAYVLVVVYFCWLLFHFEDMSALFAVLGGLFCLNGNPLGGLAATLDLRANWVLLLFCAVASTSLGRDLHRVLENLAQENRAALGLYSVWEAVYPTALLVLSVMALTGDSYHPFLYYMF